MSVLVYIENVEGTFKKSAFEAVSYAKAVADLAGQDIIALSIGQVEESELNKIGTYGVSNVVTVNTDQLGQFVNQAYASVIAEVAKSKNASTVILSNTFSGKGLAPRIAAKLSAALGAAATALPTVDGNKWQIKRTVFSSKAIATEELSADKRVISLSPNAFEVKENPVSVSVENFQPNVAGSDLSTVIKDIVRATDKVSLPEAEIVVSAGRGLKGPENWGMVEELAEILGAATACSKPVSDAGWRPHSEHVGQTGIAVSPNLYIAIGISGAIQHLAGVSASKTIVVINKDPEAPFFKVADYGIVGDAFEVIPQLIEAFKAYKNS
ncbi:electron transfer flavoprotein subunit alpha/FixB family protein [Sphingobacterium psychroaquaticum]|uniref:Electron transfer flavoprotein alpha subunit apoprotein n=1 Tax=Sphingobacterium psychroaquaticum TaxID=561061 RepID=A0A1X7L5Z8_9SPHI|nr:electron transfer flavoprotein subunit alpha/FixB family protein [Sphingobacterium psychroaquaticum]QBQ42239.1 electron transfer flavoprotein subunit alpha/FixB family protein [Sphingobacterium psychroaquaticum]SMG48529.1 electron transfer flavoprotein alpha subunit apoprotein [Sphingobacterium psychroaquaticum]